MDAETRPGHAPKITAYEEWHRRCHSEKHQNALRSLEAAMGQHEAAMEFGLYEKLDKLMFCPIDTSGGYFGELGMIALAGDIGKWVALCFPAEANWLARFISSVNA